MGHIKFSSIAVMAGIHIRVCLGDILVASWKMNLFQKLMQCL